MEKAKFTEKEIEELNDLYENFGYQCGVSEVMTFVKKELNISEINKLSISMRKHFNLKNRARYEKFEKEYENSTLNKTLIKRMSNE